MNLDHLRERTLPEHQATEALMPLMDPSLTLDQYIRSLQSLYTVLLPWEDYAATCFPEGLAALVEHRRRAALLECDLRALHAELPAPDPSTPTEIANLAVSRASFLGAMYVVEGSALGGQYIARHVADTLNLTPDVGLAYFLGYGAQTGQLWKEFKSVLAELPDTDEDEVVAAARSMFSLFAQGLQQQADAILQESSAGI